MCQDGTHASRALKQLFITLYSLNFNVYGYYMIYISENCSFKGRRKAYGFTTGKVQPTTDVRTVHRGARPPPPTMLLYKAYSYTIVYTLYAPLDLQTQRQSYPYP